jgi:hypothetical protein
VPAERGAYAWFFKEVPQGVPTDGCYQQDGLTLLYTGISPHEAFKPTTKQNLRRRIQGHYRGNASSSTLRKTLGALLEKSSGLSCVRLALPTLTGELGRLNQSSVDLIANVTPGKSGSAGSDIPMAAAATA